MDASAEVERFFREHGISSGRLLLALSGGPDSTALALLLRDVALPFELEAAHVNHHLRGDESMADEAFVRKLCTDLGLPLHVADGHLEDDAVRARGVEAAAREVRYRALRAMASERSIPWIVTAHHRDDQVETLLLRLFTGRGLHRLTGIAPRSADLLRPLLHVPRGALEAIVVARGYTPRRDSSNESRRFTRNVIRHDILPAIRRINPAVDDAIAATADDARATLHALTVLSAPEEERWRARDENAVQFRPDARPSHAVVRRMILLREIARLDPSGAREVSTRDLERLDREMREINRIAVTSRLEMVRQGSVIVLRRRGSSESIAFESAIEPEQRVSLAEIAATATLRRLERAPRNLKNGLRQVFQLPEGATPRFTIRSRREGDRFQPLGSGREKKLKDFLIDRKIPREQRDRLPLLVWQDRIVWVAGVEVSEAFKVSDRSQPLFEIEIEIHEKQERP